MRGGPAADEDAEGRRVVGYTLRTNVPLGRGARRAQGGAVEARGEGHLGGHLERVVEHHDPIRTSVSRWGHHRPGSLPPSGTAAARRARTTPS